MNSSESDAGRPAAMIAEGDRTGCKPVLRERLEAFQLDDPAAAFPFSARLARENGWSRAFALRVVREYKRFVFLCMTSDSPACPSEQVDEAWHLHLTFTRSYWDEMCGRVLERRLHHDPSRGGPSERDKHIRMYEQTLAAYRRAFEQEPPADIWPPAHIRFGIDTAHRKVNVRRNWVIPKPRGRWFPWNFSSTLAGCLALPPLALTLNPLDLRGPEFLLFFIACYAAALVAGLLLRQWLRPATSLVAKPALTPTEVALLERGRRGAITTAICQMIKQETLRIDRTENKLLWWKTSGPRELKLNNPPPADAGPLEHALLGAVGTEPNQLLVRLDAAAKEPLEKMEAELVNRGFLYERSEVAAARWLPVALLAIVICLGLAKVAVGVQRGKPVEFLVFACVVTAVTAVFFGVRPIRRTNVGEDYLRQLKETHADWKTLGPQAEALPAHDLGLAVALFGSTALAGSALADMTVWERQVLRDTASSGSSGCGGSGCGGGGCGGGGCGGGGCGGGGCGGCS